jgi:hypothetical protein
VFFVNSPLEEHQKALGGSGDDEDDYQVKFNRADEVTTRAEEELALAKLIR